MTQTKTKERLASEVVTELVQPVGAVGEVEGGEDGVVDVLGGPATDLTTAVQEDLEEADDAGGRGS